MMKIGYPLEKGKNDGFSKEGKVLLAIFILTIVIGTIVITAVRMRRLRDQMAEQTTGMVDVTEDVTTEATGNISLSNAATGFITTGVGQTLEKLTISDCDKSWTEICCNKS